MQSNIPPRTTIPHGDSFNPRPPTKKGRPDRRSRSTRACDKCKRAKSKCSGDKPCVCCIGLGLEHECTYNAPYSRGIAPKIKLNPARDQREGYQINLNNFNNIHSFNTGSIQRQGPRQGPRQLLPKLGPNGELLSDAETMASSHQQQLNGSSNHNFFPGGQQRFDMQFNGFSVPISAFGDQPMPMYRSGMVALPNKDVGLKLVATYLDKVSYGMLMLHVPSIENWAIDLLSDDGYTLAKDGIKSRNAIVLLVFASAQAYISASPSTEFDTSMRYYQLAEEQLQSETGPLQLASVQARLLQCYYLLSRGRINQCWTTFGTVVSLIFALGIHRKSSQEGIIDLIHVECQKRVFWAAFALDKFLSYALNNRPQLIQLDSIDQDIPKLVDDRQLQSTFLMPARESHLSMNFAPNLHIELSVIISKILKDIYGILKVDIEKHLELANRYICDLKVWQKKASPLLDYDHSLSKVYSRQRTELLLAYHHAYILLLRNFLLDRGIPENSNDGDNDVSAKVKLDTELDDIKGVLVQACMAICQIVETQPEFSDPTKLLAFQSSWFAQYVIYSAAVVTYIIIHQHPSPEASATPLKKSRILHQPLKTVAQPGTFIAQCVDVLDELKDAVDDVIKENSAMARKFREAIERHNNMQGKEGKEGKEGHKDNKDDTDGSEYEDAEDEVVSISSDDGSGSEISNGNVDRSGHGHGRADHLRGKNGVANAANAGKPPIMERIYTWGFERLTGR